MGKAIALLVNDLHISKDTITDFNQNWDEAIGICKDEGIKEMFIGGDMFTSRGSQTLDVLLAVKNAIQRADSMEIDVTIAEGNHDKINQESFFGYNHLFTVCPNVDAIDTFIIADYENISLGVISYFPENGSFIEKLDAMKKQLGKRVGKTVLYIHEGIHGALGDFDIPGELPNDIFSDFKKVLVGHYHNRVHIPDTNIQYIGSSRQNNFGEDEEKGYTILYDDGKTKFIKNEVNVRYMTCEIDSSDADDTFLDKLEELKNSTPPYKVRVKVNCSDAEAKTFDKQTLVDCGASKVELVTERLQKIEVQSTSIDEKFDKNGIKREYQAFCDTKGINPEKGLEYLNMI